MRHNHDLTRWRRNLAGVLPQRTIRSGENHIRGKPPHIPTVHRVIANIRVEIDVGDAKADRVLGSPAPRFGLIVARAKPDQFSVWIEQTAGKAKRLETGVGIARDLAKFAVIDALRDSA